MPSKKMRNQMAGYASRFKKQETKEKEALKV
jgi:ribosomal protein S17E